MTINQRLKYPRKTHKWLQLTTRVKIHFKSKKITEPKPQVPKLRYIQWNIVYHK